MGDACFNLILQNVFNFKFFLKGWTQTTETCLLREVGSAVERLVSIILPWRCNYCLHLFFLTLFLCVKILMSKLNSPIFSERCQLMFAVHRTLKDWLSWSQQAGWAITGMLRRLGSNSVCLNRTGEVLLATHNYQEALEAFQRAFQCNDSDKVVCKS